jgi:hypothetical protein
MHNLLYCKEKEGKSEPVRTKNQNHDFKSHRLYTRRVTEPLKYLPINYSRNTKLEDKPFKIIKKDMSSLI